MQHILDYYHQLASNNYVFYTFISVVVLFVIFNITKRWFWVLVFRLSSISCLGLAILCIIQERYLALVGCIAGFIFFGWASHELSTSGNTK